MFSPSPDLTTCLKGKSFSYSVQKNIQVHGHHLLQNLSQEISIEIGKKLSYSEYTVETFLIHEAVNVHNNLNFY